MVRVQKETGPKFTPALEAWPDAGVYQLWIELRRPLRLRVGRIGCAPFPAGVYVYTGRAARGLRARVLRHVHGGPRRHWHIDYLLASDAARVAHVLLASRDPEDECRVNHLAAKCGWTPLARFGASDCRKGCEAHLWCVGRCRETP